MTRDAVLLYLSFSAALLALSLRLMVVDSRLFVLTHASYWRAILSGRRLFAGVVLCLAFPVVTTDRSWPEWSVIHAVLYAVFVFLLAPGATAALSAGLRRPRDVRLLIVALSLFLVVSDSAHLADLVFRFEALPRFRAPRLLAATVTFIVIGRLLQPDRSSDKAVRSPSRVDESRRAPGFWAAVALGSVASGLAIFWRWIHVHWDLVVEAFS